MQLFSTILTFLDEFLRTELDKTSENLYFTLVINMVTSDHIGP